MLEEAVRRHFAIPDQDTASLILEALEPCVCRGGEWLFRQGDDGDSMFLVARGLLQVWITPPEGDGSRLIAEIGPGETVGEIGMLTGDRRSASIRAVRDTLLLRMDAAAFDRLGSQRPQLIRHIAGGIAARLRDRTAGPAPINRTVRTLALLPLDAGPQGDALVAQLAAALGREGPALLLEPGRLAALGAPPLPGALGEAMSPQLVDWLAAQEDRHRFVLYRADPGHSAWSDIAVRHADLIVLVASARAPAARRAWEISLLGATGGPTARQALVLVHEGAPAAPSGTAPWLAERTVDFHLHLRTGVPADLERLTRTLAGRGVGIVLGGGAARGFAHLGVFRAMHEAGVPIDWVGGTSIGAVVGAAIAQGPEPEDLIDAARAAFVGGRPFNDLTIPVVSLLRGLRMERLIDAHLTGDIEDLPVPFFCISSNLGDGVPHVHERGPVAKAVRASAALPGVFPPAVVDGHLAIDGAILDNLPVDVMTRRPVGRVIAVDVTSRNDYAVDYAAVPSPWSVLAGRVLPFRRRYRVPNVMSLLLKATEIGTMAHVRAAGERADLLLRPPVSRFSLTDVKAFDDIVRVGYEHARDALAGWRAH
jgi:predicted acylesterase/phospholipase RssA